MKEYRRVIFCIETDMEVEVDDNGPTEHADELLGMSDQRVVSFLMKSGRIIRNVSYDTWYE